jgi:hypothetical protein
MSLKNNFTMADQLLGRDRFPPAPPGAGRIHTIDKVAEEIPAQAQRRGEILGAIRGGASLPGAIQEALPFDLPRALLIADCEDLAECGLIRIVKDGSVKRYLPAKSRP